MPPATLTRVATAIIVIVVVLIGGIVVILQPSTLSFPEYLRAVATAVGLLGVGYGLDSHSRP